MGDAVGFGVSPRLAQADCRERIRAAVVLRNRGDSPAPFLPRSAPSAIARQFFARAPPRAAAQAGIGVAGRAEAGV